MTPPTAAPPHPAPFGDTTAPKVIATLQELQRTYPDPEAYLQALAALVAERTAIFLEVPVAEVKQEFRQRASADGAGEFELAMVEALIRLTVLDEAA